MRAMRPIEDSIAPYPIQNALTQDMRAAAAKADRQTPYRCGPASGETRAHRQRCGHHARPLAEAQSALPHDETLVV